MKLNYIKFYFSDCDELVIDGKYIKDFIISNVETRYTKLYKDCFIEDKIANDLLIEISKDGNIPHLKYAGSNIEFEDDKTTVFERLTHKYNSIDCSITNIEFEMYYDEENKNNKTIQQLQLKWVGGDSLVNSAERLYILKDGNLLIIVSDKF